MSASLVCSDTANTALQSYSMGLPALFVPVTVTLYDIWTGDTSLHRLSELRLALSPLPT